MTPYSHYLAPCEFFLLPRMKREIKEKRFADITDEKKKTAEAVSGITEDEFEKCSQQWNKRLEKCINVSGEYFEREEDFLFKN